MGGWGQKMAIFDDLQYCKSSKRWVGQSHDDVILEWSLTNNIYIIGIGIFLVKKCNTKIGSAPEVL